MPTITLTPIGGLANRMRAIASATALARQTPCNLRIYWLKDAGLNCRFDELFIPLNLPDVDLREGNLIDRLRYDHPRRRNFGLTAIPQRMLFDGRIYNQAPTAPDGSSFDYADWTRRHRRVYIASCHAFYPAEAALYRRMFRPGEAVERLAEPHVGRFSEHTVGIHIRRTDNAMAIRRSPLELFVRAMEAEAEANDRTVFFVASDSEEDKRALIGRFGSRIITSDRPADRNSLQGMQEGAADLFTLSRTKAIYGSCNSSFSEVAALIGEIPYQRIDTGL